jgi:hypothetical protein
LTTRATDSKLHLLLLITIITPPLLTPTMTLPTGHIDYAFFATVGNNNIEKLPLLR